MPSSNRVLYRNGVPVAAWRRVDFAWLGPLDAQGEWAAQNALARAVAPLRYVAGPGVAGQELN